MDKLSLPKWPGFLVLGESVTEEQAAQIIIRTGGFNFSTNDQAFEKQLLEVLQIEGKPHTMEYWEALKAREKQYGVLELEYLRNHQVVSCWIGGPNGWCSWDGKIYSNNSNIGKWPSPEEVLHEWELIAEAFPFLKLRCQLLDNEIDCDFPTTPLVEYVVADGKVSMVEPNGKLIAHKEESSLDVFIARYGEVDREIGCSLEKFRWALDVTLGRK